MPKAIDTFTSERKDLEYKSARGGFPNSFWETFSAFANTNGGHNSICRNPILQKMFVLIGIGEKAGSGADTIRKGWNDNGWVTPAIIEKYNPDSVTLVLSLEETSDKQAINSKTSDKLSEILDFISTNQSATTEAIAKEIGLSISRTRHYLGILVSGGKILPHGANRNRKYTTNTCKEY